MTISYNGLSIPKIRIYHPYNDTITDADVNFLPKMTREQEKRMARWYSNCDPATMGPESLQAMRVYSKLPLFGRIKYFHDHVWSEEFWTNRLVPCAVCRNKSKLPDIFDIETIPKLALYSKSIRIS